MPNFETVAAPARRRFCASTQRVSEDSSLALKQPQFPAMLFETRGFLRLPPKAVLPLLACFAVLLAGCRQSASSAPDADIAPQQLYMFAALQTPAAPTGTAAARVNLGRRLYYDTHLSKNNSLSCNSCHQLAKYGVDPGESTSAGWEGKRGGRNSPTVYNAALQFAQFWDGRAPTLAAQASGPMMNPVEMGMSGPEAVLKYLQSDRSYVRQFRAAYPDAKAPLTIDQVTGAIAAFEQGLITPSRWDNYLLGDVNVLSPHEKQGLREFLSVGCASCHAGQAMGGNSYARLGAVRPWPDTSTDPGRFALTGSESDRMQFKVPMLRNVERTGPWFHNGQVMTLAEAVRLMALHETGHKLSENQVDSILAFLHTLTGRIPVQYIQPSSGAESAAAGTHPDIIPQSSSRTPELTAEGE
jgi:cytochrome c peroxidase